MEIEPATIDQLQEGKDGRMILIENDVGGHVAAIKRINENLCVRFSDLGKYFVVFHRNPQTLKETLLTTAQELDGRLVERIALVTSGSYDYLSELERLDREADKAKDAKFKEQCGEIGERLAHAIREDLGIWKSDAVRSKKSWGKGLTGHGKYS